MRLNEPCAGKKVWSVKWRSAPGSRQSRTHLATRHNSNFGRLMSPLRCRLFRMFAAKVFHQNKAAMVCTHGISSHALRRQCDVIVYLTVQIVSKCPNLCMKSALGTLLVHDCPLNPLHMYSSTRWHDKPRLHSPLPSAGSRARSVEVRLRFRERAGIHHFDEGQLLRHFALTGWQLRAECRSKMVGQ